MWSSTVRRIAATAVALGSVACSGGSDSTGPDGGNGQFRFTAKIDGANWASNSGAERIGVTVSQAGLYTLTGIQLGGSGLTMVMTLTNIPGPGTYPLGVGFSVAGGNVLISSAAGPGWRTAQTGADGTITITALSSSRIEGTFTFTAVPFTGGATGNKTVTDGSFVLEVKPTGTIGPLPDNAGHKVTASFNGTSFYAAEVAANYLPLSNGTLSIAATTPTRSFSVQFTGIPANATGTYNISSAIPIRTLGVTTLNGTQVQSSYTSSATGSTGSVTITSFTATRIKGTFTAVLQPIGTQTGTMAITNGTFDIGRN